MSLSSSTIDQIPTLLKKDIPLYGLHSFISKKKGGKTSTIFRNLNQREDIESVIVATEFLDKSLHSLHLPSDKFKVRSEPICEIVQDILKQQDKDKKGLAIVILNVASCDYELVDLIDELHQYALSKNIIIYTTHEYCVPLKLQPDVIYYMGINENQMEYIYRDHFVSPKSFIKLFTQFKDIVNNVRKVAPYSWIVKNATTSTNNIFRLHPPSVTNCSILENTQSVASTSSTFASVMWKPFSYVRSFLW